MAVTTRTKRNYNLPKDMVRTQFLASATVNAWDIEGRFIRARLADTVTPNNPVAGISRQVENYRLVPFADIYNQWFTSIPQAEFGTATVSFTVTDIVISLNREE